MPLIRLTKTRGLGGGSYVGGPPSSAASGDIVLYVGAVATSDVILYPITQTVGSQGGIGRARSRQPGFIRI
jgi:hypothetical protein